MSFILNQEGLIWEKNICFKGNWLIPKKKSRELSEFGKYFMLSLWNIVRFEQFEKIRRNKSSKLYFSACYIYKRTDKATKQIRRAKSGYRYYLHRITFKMKYVKSVSGPLPAAYSWKFAERKRVDTRKMLVYYPYTTHIHSWDIISDYVRLAVVMGMIRQHI